MIQTCDLKGSQSERLIPKPAEVNMGPRGNFTGLCIPSCVLSGSRGWHHPHSPAVTPSPTLGTQQETPPCLKSLGGKSSEQRTVSELEPPSTAGCPPVQAQPRRSVGQAAFPSKHKAGLEDSNCFLSPNMPDHNYF